MTIQPRSFATRRVCYTHVEYEETANLIKKYGCPVSKVSDLIDQEGNFITVIYFDIPFASKTEFENEER